MRRKQKRRGQKLSDSSIRKDEYETELSSICSHSNNKGNDNKSRRLSFHSRYVREVHNSDNNKNSQSQNGRARKSFKAFKAKKRKSFDKDGYETLTVAGVKYSVPMVQFDRNRNKIVGDFVLVTARVFTLTKLDQLLWIQRFENRRYNHN